MLCANPSTGGVFIDDKSISRKHLTISLATVRPGDAVKPPLTYWFYKSQR